MAGQIPDPRSLDSWEDAFQHPLPVVRKLEQQLRRNIDDNRQKLRTLVGASYRDLLGTAERIIEMDEQMQTVESTLGDIGRKCNARVIERVAANHGLMKKSGSSRDGARMAAMAQTKVLQNALTMVMRLVKTEGDALQASKLLVLARLLFKSVSESPDPPLLIEELRKKLAVARKRVLAYIERVVSRPENDKALQVRSLCAYALVSSSTSRDVLRYFLQIRYQKLESGFESSSEVDMLQMLDLYSQTLVDTRDLFPRRLADSLSQLAKVPLLQDEQVQAVFELNLDIYGSWIATDIQTFTPWIRQEQLIVSDVADAIASWMKTAQESIQEGLKEYLKAQDNARSVVESRQKIIEKLLALGGRLRNESHVEAVDDIREAFLRRLKELATAGGQFDELDLAESALPRQRGSLEEQGFWGLATQDFDLAHGAQPFRRTVIQNRHGRTAEVRAQAERLDAWVEQVGSIIDLTADMRHSKWDNSMDFELDDLDDSDGLLEKLNKQDPEAIITSLRDATAASIRSMVESLSSTPSEAQHAAYYVRVWREIDRRSQVLRNRLSMPANKISLMHLYDKIGQSASAHAIAAISAASKQTTHVAVTLWDGAPPLPVQPSPASFKFLVQLQKSMNDAGADLWSLEAVQVLKKLNTEQLESRLSESIAKISEVAGLSNGHVNGHEDINGDGGDGADERGSPLPEENVNSRLLQWLFDLFYLARALQISSEKESRLHELARKTRLQLELDDAANERLDRSAAEYWKRTYLLFGLLAPAVTGSNH
jgi:conserved oligomeric Golgi complex subunit 1